MTARTRNPRTCKHERIYLDGSPHTSTAGFKRPSAERRLAAATTSGRVGVVPDQCLIHPDVFNDPASFPAALVLPDDDLAQDPKYPPQSVISWNSLNNMLAPNINRKVLYVLPSPTKSDSVKDMMGNWAQPRIPKRFQTARMPKGLSAPKTEDICRYLAAFYCGMEVRVFDKEFSWQLWDETDAACVNEESYIGLTTPSNELVRVRHRPSLDGIAYQQLNQLDILDAMMPHVPSGAYALVMVLDEDLYEDETDDFCCGRAYGGNRVAVVSAFRYNPSLDKFTGIGRDHVWPVSHCASYVDRLCPEAKGSSDIQMSTALDDSMMDTPMKAAIEAASTASTPRALADFQALWLSRIGRTISHEAAHCLFIDHCVYFACSMQGTATLLEDVRQPPYLCPVCLSKVFWAVSPLLRPAGSVLEKQRRWIKARYEAIAEMCGGWDESVMFAAWGAWATCMVQRLEFEEQ